MASNPLTRLVVAAVALKRANLHDFQQMCDAIAVLEGQAIVELIAVDEPNEVFRAQGKVRSIQQLRKHLADCAELHDTYTRRDSNAR